MIVIIDNYDSFTYNLYQYIGEINEDIKVYRNDQITVEQIDDMNPSHIIISPGPGYPVNAGISMDVIKKLGNRIPLLGVCLGHQAIGEVFGGEIIEAQKMFHGKTSIIKHTEKGVFKGIKNPLQVMRYHSLIVSGDKFNNQLEITAATEEGEIMAFQHRNSPIYGLQFHPESIMTESGKDILKNFLAR